jgi:predicted amidohydrolase YtcJ
LSREEGLRSITIWAAKACFEESVKGSLEKDKLASFVILDQDLMKVEEELLPQTKVLMTYQKGILVFKQ